MHQHSLFPGQFHAFHGGELARGKRKGLRPLARRRPIHLTLKAKRQIYAERRWIEGEVTRLAKRFHLKTYGIAVAGNHIHFAIEIPGRREYSAFIRALTAQIAKKLGKGLWSLTPFTRVANWGRDFKRLLDYIRKNREEASGERAYVPRKDWYRRFRKEKSP